MTTRAVALVIVLAAGISGCSLFRRQETPQQKFFDALNHGHAAEASQIWLAMTPDDRNKFRLGQGMSPSVPPEEVAKTLREHDAGTDEGQVTIGPNGGAGLLDLPSAATSPRPASPATPNADGN